MHPLSLLYLLALLAPPAARAQAADSLPFTTALARAETRVSGELYAAVATRLAALSAPAPLDSLHRALVSRAYTLATMEREYLHRIAGTPGWCADNWDAPNCGTPELRREPSAQIQRQQLQHAWARYRAAEEALASAAKALALQS